jgi:protein TonB
MFSQRLDASTDSAWRRAGAMFLSLGLHLFAMAIMVVIPFLYVEYIVLEEGQLTPAPLALSSYPGGPHNAESQPDGGPPHVEVVSARSRGISKIKAPLFEPRPAPPDLAVVGPTPLIYDPGPHLWYSPPCGCVALRITHVRKATLLNRVDPQYPPSARQAGIHGAVVMNAVIDREGAVRDIEVLSGPQQLRAAAVEAVRQWRYKPYELDGFAVEVDTTITVNFELTGRI